MDVRAVPAAAAASGRADPGPRIREAAVEFEAVFLAQMLRGMSAGLGPDGLFGREPFGSLLGEEYAKVIARSGGIGIADATARELLRLQEAAS